MSKKSFVIVLVCLILLAVVFYFTFTTGGKACIMRHRLHCSKCSPSPNPDVFKILSHENAHVNASLLLATCLFIRNRTSFMTRYYEPLFKYNTYVRENHPTWYYRIYVPQDFDMQLKKRMLDADMEVVTMTITNPSAFSASCWRFLPLLDDTPFLCCDSDSNDYQAYFDKVSEWRNDTSKCFFRLRGIPFIPWVSAGMWGCKPHLLSASVKADIHDLLINKTYCSCYGTDEVFVTKHVKPMFSVYGVTTHEPLKIIVFEVVAVLLAILLTFFLLTLVFPSLMKTNE